MVENTQTQRSLDIAFRVGLNAGIIIYSMMLLPNRQPPLSYILMAYLLCGYSYILLNRPLLRSFINWLTTMNGMPGTWAGTLVFSIVTGVLCGAFSPLLFFARPRKSEESDSFLLSFWGGALGTLAVMWLLAIIFIPQPFSYAALIYFSLGFSLYLTRVEWQKSFTQRVLMNGRMKELRVAGNTGLTVVLYTALWPMVLLV